MPDTPADPAPPARADSTTARVTVYYDGACPVCAREIAAYRKLRGAAELCWVDAARADQGALGPGLDRERALARFHVRDANGELVDGARAFARLWRELPALRWLGALAARPPLAWLAEPAYQLFLALRPRLTRRRR